MAESQRRGICCDSLTTLRDLDTSDLVLELRRINLQSVAYLFEKLQEVLDELDDPLMSTIEQVTSTAEDLCRLFGGNQNFNASRSSGDESIAAMLHGCSFTVQILSLGFQSYNRAHVGAFRPFFLDRTFHTVRLHGLYDHANSAPQASANFQRLTCLDDMVQQPVVVFGSFPARKEDAIQRTLRSPVDPGRLR